MKLTRPENELNPPKRVLFGSAANVFQISEPSVEAQGFHLTCHINFACQAADDIDGEIAHACIEAARQEGVHYLALLDKQFVLDALREKAERMGANAD